MLFPASITISENVCGLPRSTVTLMPTLCPAPLLQRVPRLPSIMLLSGCPGTSACDDPSCHPDRDTVLAGPGRSSTAPYGSEYASHRLSTLTWARAPTTSGPTLAVSRPPG